MTIMKPFYETLYRQSRAPWDGGLRGPLVRLVESGEIGFRGLFRVVEWLFGRQIESQAQSDFDTLKRLLEAR